MKFSKINTFNLTWCLFICSMVSLSEIKKETTEDEKYVYLTKEQYQDRLSESQKKMFEEIEVSNVKKYKSKLTKEKYTLWKILPYSKDKDYKGIEIGDFSKAESLNSIAIGNEAVAKTNGNGGTFSTSIGYKAYGFGTNVGSSSFTAFVSATAIGDKAFALAKESVSIGDASKNFGYKSISIGESAIAGNDYSISIGAYSFSTGNSSVGVGNLSFILGKSSTWIGFNTKVISKKLKKDFEKYKAQKNGRTDEVKYLDEIVKSNQVKHEQELKEEYNKSSNGNTLKFEDFKNKVIELNGESGFRKLLRKYAMKDKGYELESGTAIGNKAEVNSESGIALGENSVADKDKGQLGYGVTKEVNSIDEILKMTDKKEEYEKNKKIIANKEDEYNAMITKYENASTKDEKAKIEKEKKEWLDNNKDFMPAVKENRDIISIWKSTAGALSIGQTGYTRQLTNLAAGTNDTDAVNVAQLKQMKSYVDREVSTKVGKSAYEIWKESDVKNKDKSVQDFLASLKGEKGAKGDGESAYQSWLKQKGNEGKSESDFIASLKGEKGNNGKDGKSAFEVWKDKNKKPNATEDEFFKDITKGASLSSKEKKQMNKRIDDANEKSDLALSGVSNAIAIANLPQVSGDDKFNLSAAYGYYGTSHSLAIGISGQNNSGNFVYKLSGSINNKGNIAVGAGIGVVLGKNRYLVNDKKVENLERELKEYKDKVDRLEKLLISNGFVK